MKCKKIQDLIMSGYIDDELKGNLLKKVEQHLSVCQECKQFEQTLLKEAVTPFRGAAGFTPPESVWEGIKETISQEKKVGILETLRNGLDYFVYAPKPALAFATAAVIILLAVILVRPFVASRLAGDYFVEQIEPISYLGVDDAGYLDFGTSIEEYLM